MVELNRKYLAEKLGENELIESTCIDLSNNQISKINSNTFKKLSNLKELSLRNNEITDIYSKAFESLSSLKMLFLFGNKLNRLETKTFKGLNQLEILELNRNQISEIDLKFFECLENLRELFMDKNKLKRIDSSTFKGLSRLRVLSLNENEIVDIESNAFECLPSLKELYLVGNTLNRIDSNTFKGLGKLEILYVSRVVKIDGNSFRDNLSNLRELNLSDNSLKRIDSNSFNGLDKLEKLNLSDNDLDELDSNLFKSNSNLKCLYINNNKLKRIDTDLFKGLVKLEELLLSFNQIEFIHVGLFEGLCNLKVLWLNDNKLNEFNRKCFEPLKSIHLIQLYNNQVKALSYFSRSTQLVSWLYDKASLNKNGYLVDWSTFLEHFDESREFQNHPEVIIFDYYDDLIRDIDIYTEEQIEKYSQDDLLPIESNREYQNSVEIEGFKDPYKTEYKNDLTINVTPGSTKITDYLNQVRFKAIEEINKTRKENLSRYEIEKAKYKSDIKVEEIKRELFKEKFCFLLRIRNTNKSNRFNPKFELITVVTDFYLEHSERHLIKCLILNYLTFPFKNCLESHLISNYIIGKLRFYGNEVISITKETLQKIESISVIGSDLYGKIDFNFSLTHDFVDLSQLKSIDVHYQKLNDTNKLENLNCVQNLEYLSISNGIIKQEAFTGLDKLIRLKLENCDVYNNSLHSEMFSHLKSIENLEMSNFPKNLDVDKFNLDWLKPLGNLKKLSVQISKRYLIRCLDFLQFESLSKLEYLTLNESKIKDLVPGAFSKLKHLKYLEVNRSFYFRPDLFLGLDNLETLVIKRNEVNQNKIKLVEGVFNGLSNLKTLDLSLNNLKNIDPEVFINIPMLTHLKIVGTKLNLDENAFSHLKHLKTIEIAKSDLKHFDSNILEALRRSNIEIIIH